MGRFGTALATEKPFGLLMIVAARNALLFAVLLDVQRLVLDMRTRLDPASNYTRAIAPRGVA
jgi:hypothetical protein